MAKRAKGEKPNKSEEIRQLIKTGAKPAEIQATLAQRGIKVSMPMVYTVRSKMRARRTARKIGQRRAAANSGAPPTDIKTLARFIRAVQDVGGVAAARGVLNELGE
jgi:phosphohistidine phosphatase SixA